MMTKSRKPPTQLIGRSVLRLEDNPLVTGKGRFLDDLQVEGELHVAFVRSPVAHARILEINSEHACEIPGVVTILTAKDLSPYLCSGDKLSVGLPSSSIAFAVDRPILNNHEVAYVGEPIAAVVASTRAQAEDAVDAVIVEYEDLPASVDCQAAILEGAARAHSTLPHNRLAEFGFSYGDCEKAFYNAAVTVSGNYTIDRGGAHSIEGRGVLAILDKLNNRLDVWSSTQTPHALKKNLCNLLGRSESEISVLTPDLGGGFGPKLVTYQEEIVVPIATLITGLPVKWVEDRREHFLASCQEREQHWTAEMALDDKGAILGVRGRMVHDHGAYTARGLNVPYASGTMLPLIYKVPAYDVAITVALTNKTPVTPVRGAGQPQATFVMERLMDAAAHKMGIDRAEIRLRNLVTPEMLPCAKPLKLRSGEDIELDSGDYPRLQLSAMKTMNWSNFLDRQKRAWQEGRRLGIGLANYVEGTGRGPYESVTIRINRNGRIQIVSGATAMGQGVGTALAQIVCENLGGDINLVDLSLGDTTEPYGFGGFNSRLTVVAGASADAASRLVREKILNVAAHVLEVSRETLHLEAGLVSVADSNQFITFSDLAKLAEGLPGYSLPGINSPGLSATESVIIEGMAYSNGCCIAVVEVDVETCAVDVKELHLTHDCGRMINPMMVEGQIFGGLAHGLGNALYEKMVFDEAGQPLSTTLADYLLVTAAEIPSITLDHYENVSPLNALGAKGVGESGVIPTAAAIASAVEDAIKDLGVRITSVPITPQDLHARISDTQYE